MRILLWFLLCLLVPIHAWAQVTPIAPTEPTAVSNTVATPLSIKSLVTDAAGLTSALAAAACGDLIPIDHTVTINDGGTPFTLPAVGASCVGSAAGVSAISGSSGVHAVSGSSGVAATTATGDNYITIATDSYASLPSSTTRVTTANASLMPTLIAGNGSNGFFTAANNTHHIRFLGLHIKAKTTAAGSGNCPTTGSCGLLMLQSPSSTGTDVHHIIVDRSIVLGDPTIGTRVSIQATGANISVLNSIAGNNFDPSSNPEAQAVALDGSGPFLIHNNELGPTTSENIAVGGSLLGFYPINPCDITVTKNWIHKTTLPAGVQSHSKNLYEMKQGCRAKVDSNVFDTAYAGDQQVCIQFISSRGSGTNLSDAQFTNNWVRNCPQGLNITFRPTENIAVSTIVGDGTTNCTGGNPCVKVTLVGPCDCQSGDLVEIKNVLGTTEANGTWMPITKISSAVFTIPVRFQNAYTSGGTTVLYMAGTPVQRVKIRGNLFTNVSGASVNGGSSWSVFTFNSPFIPSPASGTYNSISSTGDWKPNDIEIAHNTFVNPPVTDTLKALLSVDESGGLYGPYTVGKGERWAIRDNVFKLSGGSASVYSVWYNSYLGSITAYGTAALDPISTTATRDWSHNIGYKSSFGDESTKFTGNDTWTTLTTTACSVVVFVDCTADTIAGAALQASSPGFGTASDATNVGINASDLASRLSGVSPITP